MLPWKLVIAVALYFFPAFSAGSNVFHLRLEMDEEEKTGTTTVLMEIKFQTLNDLFYSGDFRPWPRNRKHFRSSSNPLEIYKSSLCSRFASSRSSSAIFTKFMLSSSNFWSSLGEIRNSTNYFSRSSSRSSLNSSSVQRPNAASWTLICSLACSLMDL